MNEQLVKRAYDNTNSIMKIENALPFEDEPCRESLMMVAETFGGDANVKCISPGTNYHDWLGAGAFLAGCVAGVRHPSPNQYSDEEVAKLASEFAVEFIGGGIIKWEDASPREKAAFVTTVTNLRNGTKDNMVDLAMAIMPEEFCMMEVVFRAYAKMLLVTT